MFPANPEWWRLDACRSLPSPVPSIRRPVLTDVPWGPYSTPPPGEPVQPQCEADTQTPAKAGWSSMKAPDTKPLPTPAVSARGTDMKEQRWGDR